MPKDTEDPAQHMPDDATPEQDASLKDRKDTGPREEGMSEQVAGAPDTAERDTPLKADGSAERRSG